MWYCLKRRPLCIACIIIHFYGGTLDKIDMTNGDYIIIAYAHHIWQTLIIYSLNTHIYLYDKWTVPDILPLMPMHQDPLLVSINVCTQICYNWQGGVNSLVLISPLHKTFDLFWLCPGIDLLQPKYSTHMQIQTFQLGEKWFVTEITAFLITRWHKLFI